jgi:tetratricopeptide (TPR) repeat protein
LIVSPQHWARGISRTIAAILLLPAISQITSTRNACAEIGPDGGSSEACKAAEDLARPVAVRGRVMLEEGAAPPTLVIIERVCDGASHPEGYTDRNGLFSIQLGQNAQAVADASEGAGGSGHAFPLGTGAEGGDMASMGEAGIGLNLGSRFGNCELRARLGGYRSQTVNLRGALANPDLGVILLHRLIQGEEPTVAATTLQASKPARKAFQKSVELAKRKDFDKAMDSLREAVKLDPNFAFAWSELGKLQAAHNHVAESRQSFEAAAKSEPRWPDPLLELALLDLRTGAWKELADVTGQVLRLNSFDYPGCFFYNALANYNLGRLPMAEKSARSAQKLDTRRQFPQTAHLLGDILALNRQYAEAADQFRRYLALAPEAADAPGVRKRLEDVEKLAAGAPPTPR